MPMKNFIPNKLRPWIEARKKYKLTHAQVQMARELGLNPKKLGNMADHKQQPWKAPLPEYIEQLYLKQFGKTAPDDSRPIEIRQAEKRRRKEQSSADKNRSTSNAHNKVPT